MNNLFYYLAMRLRDAFVPVLAAGLTVASPGCAETTTEEQARVAGFDHTIEVVIEEEYWQEITGADSPPQAGDNTVNARARQVDDGCARVNDSFWYNEQDDWDCAFGLFSGCSTGPDDPQHCEKRYKTVYDYSLQQWRLLDRCVVEPRGFELKNLTGRKNEPCVEVLNAQTSAAPRRNLETHRYLVRAAVEGEEGARDIFVDVTASEWAELKHGDCIELRGPKDRPNERTLAGTCEN